MTSDHWQCSTGNLLQSILQFPNKINALISVLNINDLILWFDLKHN